MGYLMTCSQVLHYDLSNRTRIISALINLSVICICLWLPVYLNTVSMFYGKELLSIVLATLLLFKTQ